MRAVRTILSIGLVFIFAMIVSCSKKSDSIKAVSYTHLTLPTKA